MRDRERDTQTDAKIIKVKPTKKQMGCKARNYGKAGTGSQVRRVSEEKQEWNDWRGSQLG